MALKKVVAVNIIAVVAMVCLVATVSALQFETAVCVPVTEDSPVFEDVKQAVDWIRTISGEKCCQIQPSGCTTIYTFNSTDLDLCGDFNTCIGCKLPAGTYYDEILAQCVRAFGNGKRVEGYIEKTEENGDSFTYVIQGAKCQPHTFQKKIIKQIVN
ncbi:hypothetical protein Mapa_014426 [Marchantia paleacea]|nr:hypothetical protein Mapa_014426 [Marchantia paleacea]